MVKSDLQMYSFSSGSLRITYDNTHCLDLPVSTQAAQPDMTASFAYCSLGLKVLVPIPWCTSRLRRSDYGKEAGAGAKAYPIIWTVCCLHTQSARTGPASKHSGHTARHGNLFACWI